MLFLHQALENIIFMNIFVCCFVYDTGGALEPSPLPVCVTSASDTNFMLKEFTPFVATKCS
jgi:hypothetical protein